MFELELDTKLTGPCFRCLEPTEIATPVRGREYQASDPDGDEELQTPYVAENKLDLSTWARDTIALELPEKILCREDCAGLCPTCGRNLNDEPHTHEEETVDSRWAALAELKDQL